MLEDAAARHHATTDAPFPGTSGFQNGFQNDFWVIRILRAASRPVLDRSNFLRCRRSSFSVIRISRVAAERFSRHL